MANYEKSVTSIRKVFCEGDSNTYFGHPGVYLVIPENETLVVCPYCSKEFVLLNGAHD